MDSPAAYPESPMEQDDAAYPCKGCGEVRLSHFDNGLTPGLTFILTMLDRTHRFLKKGRLLNSVRTTVSSSTMRAPDVLTHHCSR